MDTPRGEKWVESHIEADSAFYFTTLALVVQSCQRWNSSRLVYLGRLLVTAHCRAQQKTNEQRQEKEILDYSVYKPALVFFAIINGVYNMVLKVELISHIIKCDYSGLLTNVFLFQNVTVGEIDSDWPGTVAEYIRHNDETVLRGTDKLLNAYQNDYLTCGSFDEFCDVAGNF